LGATPHSAFAAGDDDKVEQFLTRLGLVELQTVHLEQVLAKQQDDTKRQELAKRLADVYAGQLITFAEDKTKYDRVFGKINELLTRVPEAKTPSLEVMLLQADYYRAEGLIGKWISDRDNTAPRDEAKDTLAKIAPELDRLQKQLNERLDKLLETIDYSQEGEQLKVQERELRRLQAIVGRASYFAAWSNYYLGLANEVADSPEYIKAREIFRRVLGIGDDYEDIDAEYLGLASIWRARSLIGLALAEAALNATVNSDRCFELLGDPSVPPDVRDQTAYWRLQSLVNIGRYPEAITFAKQKIADFSDTPTQGKVSFCISLIQAGFAGSIGSPKTQPLGLLGLGGLVKIGQRQTAQQMMAKYQVKLDDSAGFYLLWIQGQHLFDQAEKTKKKEDYQAAAAMLSRALEGPVARDDIGSSGQCRSRLAWCQYRLGQHETAGREFQAAAERLIAAKHKAAFDSAKMALVCFQEASKSDPRFKQNAITVLAMIKREFPNNELAKRADYYIGKLRQNASPADTIRSLNKVQPESPDYLPARYEICVLSHQIWNKADADGKANAGRQLLEAVKTYLAGTGARSDKAQRTRACLLAADVSLNGAVVDVDTAKSYLERAGTWTRDLPAKHQHIAEYHFRTLQLAQQQSDETQQRLHASWIVENAAGSRYELPALIVTARTIDKAIKTSGSGSPEQRQNAYNQYSRLVKLLGESSEAIAANKNTQVANSKLAHYARQIGKHDEAAQRLESLLAAGSGPKNKAYLRRAGLAQHDAGNYQAAIHHWRTLLRGVKRGSDEWFEAKYYQLSCLFHIDPEKARVVFDQFELLYPKLGPPEWRDKFAAVGGK
jgi:hypothetical protein